MSVYAIIGFALRIMATAIILFYIIPKAFRETLRPKDWLTGLRWQMFSLFSLSVISSIPGVVYQFLLSSGDNSPVLRNVATLTGSLSFFIISVILVMIYNYERKDK